MKNIVTIGGGTGSFTLLTGLKKYPINISAIVSMADDGGSTGVLRDELGVLPPGDIRQCLVALSESTEIVRELMSYRFESGSLKGHNFGNLFLSALAKIKRNFASGVGEASKILNVRGKVIPVANKDMRLCVRLNDGRVVKGQRQLDRNETIRRIGIKDVFLAGRVKAYELAIQKIKEADYIIIGPGDHCGSILTNLLVLGIPQAVKKAKAKVIYNCNLTNKKGQTDKYTLVRYIAEIEKFIGKGRIDFATFNNKIPDSKLLRKYERREGKNSLVEAGDFIKGQPLIVRRDLLSEDKVIRRRGDMLSKSRSFIRHDPAKLAEVVMEIIDGKIKP